MLITGIVYTARDAAHKRLIKLLDEGGDLPFDIRNQIIYYVGPTPARPGYATGSAGPTTSYRMDKYAPALLDRGLRGMIGKGLRSKEVAERMMKNKAVYFAANRRRGGAISKRIKSSKIIAYEDLGAEPSGAGGGGFSRNRAMDCHGGISTSRARRLRYYLEVIGAVKMNYMEESLKLHYSWKGKLEIRSKAPVNTREELSLAYTPGVAQPCLEIQKDVSKSLSSPAGGIRWPWLRTARRAWPGDIGPEAGMPVMEGKCVLFREFGAWTPSPLHQVKGRGRYREHRRPAFGSFGGVNLEDIFAPRCLRSCVKLKRAAITPSSRRPSTHRGWGAGRP